MIAKRFQFPNLQLPEINQDFNPSILYKESKDNKLVKITFDLFFWYINREIRKQTLVQTIRFFFGKLVIFF